MCRVMDDPCVLLRECGLIPSAGSSSLPPVPRPACVFTAVACAGGGGSFHEAAGSRSLRRFIIRPAEVFLLSAMVAGAFFPGRRVRGCVRAGRVERYNSADWTVGRREKLRTSSAVEHSPNT